MTAPLPRAPRPPPETAPPPAADALGRALALASAAAWIVIVGAPGRWCWIAVAVLAVGGAVGLRRGSRDAAALALATAALALVPALSLHVMLTWTLLAVSACAVAAYRLAPPWLARGELSSPVLAWIAAIVVVSGAALVGWWALVRPALGALTLPPWARTLPAPAVAGLFLAWAGLNAAVETLYFRGLMQHALVATLGRSGVVVQAAAFGLVHYRGVPSGAAGVVLATAYGLMLGALRERARGLLAPWLAHLAADAVIAALLLLAAR